MFGKDMASPTRQDISINSYSKIFTRVTGFDTVGGGGD
jgi:hypothetical protein